MIIAFIPVRGGSKSIPLKNIKSFCGKPLVCWTIEALEACKLVDEIIIATDSEQIQKVVLSFGYTKVKIYRRSSESASDTAATEWVMLEYINYARLSNNDIFMLVQATSPLTETSHFNQALKDYLKGGYDSMLTCVRNYRFYWCSNGISKNYDYKNRPRRQDFAGELMENGAFYINTVQNIVESGNRLSGKIGIYEMPEYTATEIDEPDDWMILEHLMRKHVLLPKKKQGKCKIKLFLTDVDGTLTDGGMYYSENGDEMKKFNTRDGMGLQLLRERGIKTGIITSENTKIVENRANKLKVDFLYQGNKDGGKIAAAKEICETMGITLEEVAYIGDDINCLNLLENVRLSFCPSDAMDKVKNVVDYISEKKGGEGAVRDCIEYLLRMVDQREEIV
ncbi:acylneuraminate cytidylyltransferase [Bacteroides nordii]|uniref:acylneuraminate cytidylyltransferase n=1 Tax=Bacteroides nordii TaxID=291645 RepID=UPI00241DB404|nr:acylneuraminate cytidylyltransferase [Bacteroides nordii]